jgi:hypothetical protein
MEGQDPRKYKARRRVPIVEEGTWILHHLRSAIGEFRRGVVDRLRVIQILAYERLAWET